MQRIPVDLSRCLVQCTELPAPRVRDGRPMVDRDSGAPLFTVGVCVIQERTADVVRVTVVGEPAGLVPGGAVTVRGLVASPWEREDERSGRRSHGIAFRAESITPALPPGGSAAAGPGPGGPGRSGPVAGGRSGG
jgi:hypothetical protein